MRWRAVWAAIAIALIGIISLRGGPEFSGRDPSSYSEATAAHEAIIRETAIAKDVIVFNFTNSENCHFSPFQHVVKFWLPSLECIRVGQNSISRQSHLCCCGISIKRDLIWPMNKSESEGGAPCEFNCWRLASIFYIDRNSWRDSGNMRNIAFDSVDVCTQVPNIFIVNGRFIDPLLHLECNEKEKTNGTPKAKPNRKYLMAFTPGESGEAAKQQTPDNGQPECGRFHGFSLHEILQGTATALMTGLAIGIYLGFYLGLCAKTRGTKR